MSKRNIILIHLLFWIILLWGVVLMSFGTPFLLGSKYGWIVVAFHLLIPLFFYTAYFCAFRILRQRKALRNAFLVLAGVLLLLLALTGKGAVYLFGFMLFWLMLGGMTGYFFDWFRKDKQQAELGQKSVESELALLKSRIQPHFLFNTLHSIDALIATDPQRASDMLIRLSGLMRYMTYDSGDRTVPLEKEIGYIENYVSLQRLGLTNPDMVSFEVTGSAEGKEIAPMLFIPFVENAFKHAVEKQADDNIRIRFAINEKEIGFEVSNRYDPEHIPASGKYNGSGLTTVTRRLELLCPGCHTLALFARDGRFYVKLKIGL